MSLGCLLSAPDEFCDGFLSDEFFYNDIYIHTYIPATGWVTVIIVKTNTWCKFRGLCDKVCS